MGHSCSRCQLCDSAGFSLSTATPVTFPSQLRTAERTTCDQDDLQGTVSLPPGPVYPGTAQGLWLLVHSNLKQLPILKNSLIGMFYESKVIGKAKNV